MTTRRQVMGAGLVLSVLPGLVEPRTWHAWPGPGVVPVERWLVDKRYPDAIAMSAHAMRDGETVTAIERDVLGPWHDQLLPGIRDGELAAFGGVTDPTTLFLLQTLAADQRMHVAYRADHAWGGRGVMRHVLSGNAPTVSRIASAAGQDDWRLRFGQALRQCHATGRPARRTVLTAADHCASPGERLVSWIIVSRRSVA